MENIKSSTELQQNAKYVKIGEFILYLISVFFYSNLTGMVLSYRNAYLVNVLLLSEKQASLFNALVQIIPFVLNFFIVMYMDGRKMGKHGKFRPLGMLVAIPMGILVVLSFWAPKSLSGVFLMIYIVTVAVAWAVCNTLGNSVNLVAFVMSPNMKERDTVISFRGIASAVGNSAPLVIVLVLGMIWKNDEAMQYIVGAALCGAVGIATMLLGMNAVSERVVYAAEKKNPLAGFKDILSNKYALLIIISEFLKNFRQLSTFMGPFLAAALLGGTDKYVIFALPTGIGTAIGMLVINFLLKKFNSKVLYIASGMYSIIINSLAFTVGYMYFKNPSSVLLVLFVLFLFLIGLQFGASNLLPQMFQADVLEDIEFKTGKRLDASLPFVISVGTVISGTIATALAPPVLYGNNPIIGYVPNADEQTLKAKILLLFFYTIVHGIMMFLAGVPFFFYKLTGKTKEDIHNAVIEKRKGYGSSTEE